MEFIIICVLLGLCWFSLGFVLGEWQGIKRGQRQVRDMVELLASELREQYGHSEELGLEVRRLARKVKERATRAEEGSNA